MREEISCRGAASGLILIVPNNGQAGPIRDSREHPLHAGGIACRKTPAGRRRRHERLHFSRVQSEHARSEWVENRAAFREAIRQLEFYFEGKLFEFQLNLRPAGTAFQLAVWMALREIPYGQTITYGKLAVRIGNPAASRAVGLANGANPIAIVIPCHRVIGADGRLTGFGGSLT
jgi:methylated-DNA-[protein]-cysteine S-methyltransferase